MLLPAAIFGIKTLSGGRIENRNNSRQCIQKEKLNIGSQALKKSLEVWIPGWISWNDPWWSADLIWEGAVHSPKIRNVMNRELALGHLGVNTLNWAHTHTHDSEIRNGIGKPLKSRITVSQFHGSRIWTLNLKLAPASSKTIFQHLQR